MRKDHDGHFIETLLADTTIVPDHIALDSSMVVSIKCLYRLRNDVAIS